MVTIVIVLFKHSLRAMKEKKKYLNGNVLTEIKAILGALQYSN